MGSDSAQAESDGVHLVLLRRHRAKTNGTTTPRKTQEVSQMNLKEKMLSVSRRRKTNYLKNKTKTTKKQNHKPRLTANASALKEIGKRGLTSKQTVSTGKLLEITDLRGNEN